MATGITTCNISKAEISKYGEFHPFEITYVYVDTRDLALTKSGNFSYKNILKYVECSKLYSLSEGKDFILRLRKKAAASSTISLVEIDMRESDDYADPSDYPQHYWSWKASENI